MESIEEIIQRDIDDICEFGHYRIDVAYKTLIFAQSQLTEKDTRISELEAKERLWQVRWDFQDKKESKLKQENKELKETSKNKDNEMYLIYKSRDKLNIDNKTLSDAFNLLNKNYGVMVDDIERLKKDNKYLMEKIKNHKCGITTAC